VESWVGRIVADNYSDIHGFAYRMTGNRETARDIAQETFLRYVERDGAPNGEESARRWLFVVARNLCLSRFRTESRHSAAPPDSLLSIDSVTDPSTLGEQAERSAWVQAAVMRLPSEMREVIVLREYANLGYAEMAAVIGCAEGTVKSRLARARETLAKLLAPNVEDYR